MKLSELFNPNEFAARHLSFGDEAALLAAVGEKSMDDFVGNTLPQSIRMPSELDLPEALTEADALAKLKGIASKNVINKSYIGLGYYPTRVPNVILRNVLENPGWYTAYTPYQAEIAQGRLEALLNFQQGCIDLTGFPVAGASLLDEATAAAEAMAMAHRVGKVKSERFFVDARVYPQTLDVMKTRAKYFGFELVVSDFAQADEGEYFGALFQYVGKDGDVQDLQDVIGRLKAKGTIVAVAADIMSLVLLKSPAELGADIALGNTQRFGVPMGFGGPHAAYFAFKDEFKRSAPGRIIGVSKDASGKPALRMALSTREQHIRREKATSNICTAQALLANLAGMYAVYHGPKGVKRIANRIHTLASVFADALVSDGLKVVHEVFFDTVTVDFGSKEKADQVFAAALESGYNLRSVNNTQVAAAFHETSVYEDLADLYRAFTGKDTFTFADDVKGRLNAELLRQDDILQHPVYNSYHTEHEMLRYLKKLEDRDLAMNRSMISLGSCTMKLNATAEMLPITWTEFSDIHPYAPEAQTAGYRELLADMENSLKAITGFDAISFQPNSGAQGEYSGMLAIRRYQEAQGEAHRNICLIPKSAHGTNPATAAMLGLKVVVVDTDEHGNVNIDDLKAKAEQHRDALSAIMITYPSTHGVYEEGIRDICRIIHENGGQVYMDGANLNAQIGIMQPAEVGADVLHMNLHKTFCIPHGGGGPGMGPIGLKAHLAPFAPGHTLTDTHSASAGQTSVAAAAFGSASILPITWMYLTMMGKQGMEQATRWALLNANYVAKRLSEDYPILYTGKNGRIAHECIVDLRPLKAESGITETDIAKRLMDYGFHAPTVSFPVAGTLMIEPTESESKAELDRFIAALKSIRREVQKVIDGEWPKDDNPLVNAPHTAADITGEWAHPYSREEAVFPLPFVREHKFWPFVNRVDDVYGDRNLVCSCPPMENYED
ncbi:aminomethyl-transferring glycine dehydrogenase [Neisseria gonorrhoeae]|uniref:aminomethyl-transferring glycine dehydrogenase n=1 Tax=Neisseria gonorrhoeae TaxID=485 RepID=UPI0001AF37B6|nr:aminomethyl-transferring glycine dehydrogenase [Neisseria gonorrhoeae]ANJ48185.1 glycine dehydrogenase (aminomethyl-transferring) [Neisseria gonorrhoeae]ARC01948.1 glycine dehydrogenase (aminomethyl-transferring) [Neisseria gonorrhoeae]ARC03382.1 glycine dehydrogenase (aminomethyl-transferring) [Neisseria gonorrhoeae]AZG27821.1 glycine dehydrogenase (aminomethyl-transferring) [Neisseria gonorrhoeae]AZG70217.1 glycine dehydrogenase (aminomethyl-transferring) [Neisseria gonorrhoeae]